MKRFLQLLSCIALAACALDAHAYVPPNSEFMSFAELYQVTVGEAPATPHAAPQAGAQVAEYQVRVAAREPSASAGSSAPAPSSAPARSAAGYSFSNPAMPEPAS